MSVAKKSRPIDQDAKSRSQAQPLKATLAVKVIAAIVVVSLATTAVFSVIEVTRDSRTMIANEKSESQAVLETNRDSLALAVWTIDERAIEVTARSLVRGKSIYRVEISDDFGKTWDFVRPDPPERADAEWSRSLLSPNGQEVIGTVHVWENYDDVRALLKQRMFSLVVAELIKVALLATLLFVIVHRTMTGPLKRLAQRLQSADRQEPITLDRPFHKYPDEIDALVDAINESNRERVRLEAERERRRQYEERASKLEALGRLAGGVAHDFNNVLSVMSGYTEFLREDLPPNSNVREYAERLAQCNESAKKLVRQILAFSRNEAVALKATSVAATLEDIRPILRSAIPTSTDLVYEVDDRLTPVTADANQITQVLLNLVMNAHDACDGKPGRVVIRAGAGRPTPAAVKTNSMTVLEFDSDKPHVRIEVEDAACGMTAEVMRKIFEPFYTTKAVGKGTGLGLAIVYNIVKLHSGGLSVYSTPGKGTSFCILLPVAAGADVREMPATSAVRAASALRILVVDDEPSVGDMLRVGLSRSGYEVVYRRNPLEALALIEAGPQAFNVVLTDQVMPEMSGIDLIRWIKARNPEIRCILSTGYSEQIDADAARTAGANAFVHKPASVNDLVGLIEEMFREPRV